MRARTTFQDQREPSGFTSFCWASRSQEALGLRVSETETCCPGAGKAMLGRPSVGAMRQRPLLRNCSVAPERAVGTRAALSGGAVEKAAATLEPSVSVYCVRCDSAAGAHHLST